MNAASAPNFSMSEKQVQTGKQKYLCSLWQERCLNAMTGDFTYQLLGTLKEQKIEIIKYRFKIYFRKADIELWEYQIISLL